MNLPEIQKHIRDHHGDGWLFCDFHARDKIAHIILNLDRNKLFTRRWFYFIPKEGDPIKLVHKIENNRLNGLPGQTTDYLSWRELHNKLRNILKHRNNIFMQFSPNNNIPTVSYVDAGTVDLIRSFGKNVISSANLVQRFEATIDREGMALHKKAGIKIQRIKDMAFQLIMDSIQSKKNVSEYDVQAFILANFKNNNLTCDGLLPIVAVNAHAADPHFDLMANNSLPIRENDRVLIDLWARENVPSGIYYDITWCGYMGRYPNEEYVKLFDIVVRARNIAKHFIIDKMKRGASVFGWQVDDICRNFIKSQGYGDYFIHRTGHSIHKHMHGNGVNMDNLETRDDREIIPGTCFSIEPGIYKNDIGVRSEINVLINKQHKVIVVGKEQTDLILMKTKRRK